MSISKQTTVWCDDCRDWKQQSATAAQLRKRLKKKGWTQEGTQDFCPACSKKRKV